MGSRSYHLAAVCPFCLPTARSLSFCLLAVGPSGPRSYTHHPIQFLLAPHTSATCSTATQAHRFFTILEQLVLKNHHSRSVIVSLSSFLVTLSTIFLIYACYVFCPIQSVLGNLKVSRIGVSNSLIFGSSGAHFLVFSSCSRPVFPGTPIAGGIVVNRPLIERSFSLPFSTLGAASPHYSLFLFPCISLIKWFVGPLSSPTFFTSSRQQTDLLRAIPSTKNGSFNQEWCPSALLSSAVLASSPLCCCPRPSFLHLRFRRLALLRNSSVFNFVPCGHRCLYFPLALFAHSPAALLSPVPRRPRSPNPFLIVR